MVNSILNFRGPLGLVNHMSLHRLAACADHQPN